MLDNTSKNGEPIGDVEGYIFPDTYLDPDWT